MKALIVSGGTIIDEFATAYLKNQTFDYVIAADRGLEFCDRMKLHVDYIVGDFDSIDQKVIDFYEKESGIPTDRYNPVKDYTDTGIAMRKVVEEGATEVVFLGATGTRLDHSMSNIFCLYYLYERNIKGVIVDANNRITMPLEKDFCIRKDEQYGGFVSFFPYSPKVEKLCLEGFKYPVKDYSMGCGDEGLFVSNEIIAETAHVKYEDGILIMVESRD